MGSLLQKLLFTGLALPLICFAGSVGTINPPKSWSLAIQGGFYVAAQDSTQHININGLIGNQYILDDHSKINGLAGLGLYFNGPSYHWLQLSYGVNAFYFGQNSVKGDIIQEDLFTNLSYQYTIQNLPVYAAAKALIYTNNPAYNLTVEAGIGPNFMWTSGYHETPLFDYVIPDNAFTGASETSFSVTVGAGVRLNNLIGHLPFECGYRFFYLGEGHLNRVNDQYFDQLNTGDSYANALVCAITL